MAKRKHFISLTSHNLHLKINNSESEAASTQIWYHQPLQWWWKTLMLGGVWGYAPPGKILQIRCSEIASEATFGPKRYCSYHCYLYIFACMTLIRIDVHMPLLKSPNFGVSSAEYYIGQGLLSLGRGHNVARLDTRAPGSLRHAARFVVSICEYTVSNKGGLPCHCHDCGAMPGMPPLPPQFRRLCSLIAQLRMWFSLLKQHSVAVSEIQ